MTLGEIENPLLPKGTSWKQSSISPGILQIVLMYALQLRQELCEVFILCDVQGCSIAETASLLRISSELVEKRLNKARQHMEEVVARFWDEAAESA